jgi:MoaA/NifB/PqqE/SkfB family radical SAM enzyme
MLMKNVLTGFQRGIQLFRRHGKYFLKHNTLLKMINLLKLYMQRMANRSRLTAYPFEVIIDPLNICNLRCPLCPTGRRVNSRPPGKMQVEAFQKIIDELGPYLYKVRMYNWGEPLLHHDIYKMIAYASKNNISTEISTNLTVLRPEDAAQLVRSGLELLIISLDGADSETYSRYRRGGDFNIVIENIAAIVREKIESGSRYPIIEIQFLVMKHNEHQIQAIKRLAKDLKVDSLKFGPVTINIKNVGDRTFLPTDEGLSRYYYVEAKDKIYASRKKCEWLWRSSVINWDMTVAPCCVYEGPQIDFGRLGSESFLDIWNNDRYRQAREVFIGNGSTQATTVTICHYCKGSPRALSDTQAGLY